MQINRKVIEGINAAGINLDELAYLYSTFFNENWELNIFPASILKLERRNLIKEGVLTTVGENTLFDCLDETKTVVVKSDRFDEIWMTFPRDDEFKGFPRTRAIRTNKSGARVEYQNALGRGYTHEALLQALRNEIAYRSESTKENLFKYMRSPVNWFKNETYLDYMNIESQPYIIEHGKNLL